MNRLLALLGLAALAFAPCAAAPQSKDRGLTRAVQQVDMTRKVALVVGNAAYKVQPLANPVIDANAMAKALREDFGFDVTVVTDADRTRMVQALAEFKRKLAGAGVALFYFAGHGVQVDGVNYLIPTGVSMEDEEQVRYNTIKVDDVLDALAAGEAQVRIVILDACRNNPFQRTRGGSGGLASPGQAPRGTLIAYATAPGRVAADGRPGENGVYTRHLLEAMREPGRPVEEVFKVTRTRVAAATNGQQIPWETTSLEGNLVFRPGAPQAAPGTQAAASGEALAFRGLALKPRPAPLEKGATFRDCERCPEMVVIPAGSFRMGSPPEEPQRRAAEGPQRQVKLPAFAVGRFEVTFEEWEACLLDGGGCNRWPDDQGLGRGRRPVTDVSWDDAQSYVAWLSRHTGKKYRLLAEAEWEYVARAGGSEARPAPTAGGAGALPVDKTVANAWKVHGMLGNVWEWAADCTNPSYAGAPADGSAWLTGDCARRVLRGGAWTTAPRGVRAATRSFFPAGRRDVNIGFRVATSLD